jgi:hypothetical protein
MLKLWGHRKAPNVAKVLWGLGELGLDYTLIEVGGSYGGTDRPDYRAMNPNGRIPHLRMMASFCGSLPRSCAIWPGAKGPMRCILRIPGLLLSSTSGWTGKERIWGRPFAIWCG